MSAQSDNLAAGSCGEDRAVVYTTPLYSRSQVDRAGRTLVDPAATPEGVEQALQIINNWRTSHGFPLNTFTVGLRDRASKIDPNALTAQRIKRLASIRSKLIRFKGLRLSQLQDFGGCRAVVQSMENVGELVSRYQRGNLKHKLVRKDDYIATPQPSGYRGVHLIYRYYSDKKATYNDMQIEVQLRTQQQHAWATAVETVGTFTRQALKSSQGEQDWLRFFALMGSAMAYDEDTPGVPETPGNAADLIAELGEYAARLDVANKLRAYGAALQRLGESELNAHYFLLVLEPSTSTITVAGFARTQLEEAQERYLAVERTALQNEERLAVLVSVDSVTSLQRAYPNYFLDTQVFVDTLHRVLDGPAQQWTKIGDLLL